MKKLTLLIGVAIGYVLGTKAGRERYDQIRDAAVKVKDDPRVQEKVHQATDFAAEKAPVVKDKVAGAATSAAAKVKDRTGGGPDASAEDEVGASLNPDRIKLGEDTGPQGDLP